VGAVHFTTSDFENTEAQGMSYGWSHLLGLLAFDYCAPLAVLLLSAASSILFRYGHWPLYVLVTSHELPAVSQSWSELIARVRVGGWVGGGWKACMMMMMMLLLLTSISHRHTPLLQPMHHSSIHSFTHPFVLVYICA